MDKLESRTLGTLTWALCQSTAAASVTDQRTCLSKQDLFLPQPLHGLEPAFQMNDVETFSPFQFWLVSDARLGISHTPGSHSQSHAPAQRRGSATRPPSLWCSEETPWHRAWCLQVSTWFCWAKCWHAGLQW